MSHAGRFLLYACLAIRLCPLMPAFAGSLGNISIRDQILFLTPATQRHPAPTPCSNPLKPLLGDGAQEPDKGCPPKKSPQVIGATQ